MSRTEMSDDKFVKFQDQFYCLLENFGVTKITCEHKYFNEICEVRNKVAEFIEEQVYMNNNK